jgi:hypothetical protein
MRKKYNAELKAKVAQFTDYRFTGVLEKHGIRINMIIQKLFSLVP